MRSSRHRPRAGRRADRRGRLTPTPGKRGTDTADRSARRRPVPRFPRPDSAHVEDLHRALRHPPLPQRVAPSFNEPAGHAQRADGPRVTRRARRAAAPPTGRAGRGRSSPGRRPDRSPGRRLRARTACRPHPDVTGTSARLSRRPPSPTLGTARTRTPGSFGRCWVGSLGQLDDDAVADQPEPDAEQQEVDGPVAVALDPAAEGVERRRRSARDGARCRSGPRGRSRTPRRSPRGCRGTRPTSLSVAFSTAATAAATTGHPWTMAAMNAAPNGPTVLSGSGTSGFSGASGSSRLRRPRRSTRRTSAATPSAIWRSPAEEMVLDESCCCAPPARNTVRSATTAAHSIQPAMKPQVLRRPPRSRMAM